MVAGAAAAVGILWLAPKYSGAVCADTRSCKVVTDAVGEAVMVGAAGAGVMICVSPIVGPIEVEAATAREEATDCTRPGLSEVPMTGVCVGSTAAVGSAVTVRVEVASFRSVAVAEVGDGHGVE